MLGRHHAFLVPEGSGFGMATTESVKNDCAEPPSIELMIFVPSKTVTISGSRSYFFQKTFGSDQFGDRQTVVAIDAYQCNDTGENALKGSLLRIPQLTEMATTFD